VPSPDPASPPTPPTPAAVPTPPPAPPVGYCVVRFLVLPVGSGVAGESAAAGVDPVSVENPGGAAEKAKPKGKGGKTAARAGKAVAELTATATTATPATPGEKSATAVADTAPSPSLPAHLLTIVADCEARGIPVTVTAVAYTPDPDAVESGSERLVCRWPSLATPSGWSAWESEGVVSSRANPTIREARRKVRAARGVGSGGGMGGGAE
jgi:hypothetical protein